MQISDFHKFADKALGDLVEKIEKIDVEGKWDADLHDGILSLTLENGRQYIINKHQASLKIWVSSPVSGAAYFVCDERQGAWLDGVVSLEDKILGELREIAE